jgi:hypothetical protein
MLLRNLQTAVFALGGMFIASCLATPDETGQDRHGVLKGTLNASEVTFPVSIRGTGTATLAAHVYSNPAIHGGLSILGVPGVSETGTVFAPLAGAIFSDGALKLVVKNVIGLDLPGRADSTFPSNLPAGLHYGDLTIEDDASMSVQAVDALRKKGLPVAAVLGHSLGGLDLLVAQQTLLAQGSSLARHGVFAGILLSPVPPQPLAWTPPPGDLSPFIVNDPTLGLYLMLPPPVWIAVAFTTTAGQIASDAPSPDQVTAARYVGPEPLGDLVELGSPQRPTVSPGIFAPSHGTVLGVVGFSEDSVVQASFMKPLYELVTQDQGDFLYRQVTAADAVHAMMVSNPEGLLDALRPML